MKNIVMAALSLLDGIVGLAVPHHRGSTRYPTGHGPSGRGFHPGINRNTARPHEHRREIARRLRQAARA